MTDGKMQSILSHKPLCYFREGFAGGIITGVILGAFFTAFFWVR